MFTNHDEDDNDQGFFSTIKSFWAVSKKSQKEHFDDFKFEMGTMCKSILRKKGRLESERDAQIKLIENNIKKNRDPEARTIAEKVIGLDRQINMYGAYHTKLDQINQKMENLKMVSELGGKLSEFTDLMSRVNKSMDLEGMEGLMKSFDVSSQELDKKTAMINSTFESISKNNTATAIQNQSTGLSSSENSSEIDALLNKIRQKVNVEDVEERNKLLLERLGSLEISKGRIQKKHDLSQESTVKKVSVGLSSKQLSNDQSSSMSKNRNDDDGGDDDLQERYKKLMMK
jgi:hypothetical protein